MAPGALLLGLWLLGLAVAVARRSWAWFGVAAVVGVAAALVQGGAATLVTSVHEDGAAGWGIGPALGWVGLGNLLAAGVVAWRRR